MPDRLAAARPGGRRPLFLAGAFAALLVLVLVRPPVLLPVLAAAEFTSASSGSGTAPPTYRAEVEAHAATMLDRDGRFHTDWLLEPADGDGAPNQ